MGYNNKLNWIELVKVNCSCANWMQLLARPSNPNRICFRLPQPAKAVTGTTTLLKIVEVSLSFPSPFPQTPVDCCFCPGPFQGCLHGNDHLADWQLSDCGLGEDDNPGHSYTNFQHTDMHSLPSPPIPRLRLLCTPSVTGSVTGAVLAAGPGWLLVCAGYLLPPLDGLRSPSLWLTPPPIHCKSCLKCMCWGVCFFLLPHCTPLGA